MSRWIGLAARLVVGTVWVVAGALKLPDPAATVRAVRAYQLLPEAVVPTLGHVLPIVEILIGVLLVVGLLTRAAGAASALLMLAFVVGISAAWARGLQIECGCFGGGGAAGLDADPTAAYPWDIARDVALAAASLWLVARPRTALSLDSVLLAPLPQPERSIR